MPEMSEPTLVPIHRIYSRALKNFRSLYVYLPPSYMKQPHRKFPVLYMQDGQNIFSGDLSYSGVGWEIHKTTDVLIKNGALEELIIVGIAHNNAQRLHEYAHFDGNYNGRSIKGRADLYEKFLIEDVMPFIEANFRVKTGAAHTGLMGSSMGGLVTFVIGLKHPNRFGKLGVVSPSFWWNRAALSNFIASLEPKQLPKRMWIDMGASEGDMMQGFEEMLELLFKKGVHYMSELAYWIVPDGAHSEYDWQCRAHHPLLYLFGKIGQPERLELHAPDFMEQNDPAQYIRADLIFDSGFRVTPEPIEFFSSDPEILSIGWDLKLYASQPGEVILTGLSGNFSAEYHCTVLEKNELQTIR